MKEITDRELLLEWYSKARLDDKDYWIALVTAKILDMKKQNIRQLVRRMKKRKSSKRCTKCNGNGYIKIAVVIYINDLPKFEKHDCPKCSGTGRITVYR